MNSGRAQLMGALCKSPHAWGAPQRQCRNFDEMQPKVRAWIIAGGGAVVRHPWTRPRRSGRADGRARGSGRGRKMPTVVLYDDAEAGIATSESHAGFRGKRGDGAPGKAPLVWGLFRPPEHRFSLSFFLTLRGQASAEDEHGCGTLERLGLG